MLQLHTNTHTQIHDDKCMTYTYATLDALTASNQMQ
jgi:hypothetical protein